MGSCVHSDEAMADELPGLVSVELVLLGPWTLPG